MKNARVICLLSLFTLLMSPVCADPTWVSYFGHWIDNTTYSDTIEMWNVTGTTDWTPPTGVSNIWALCVAGGGGGGGYAGGGGGAGGLLNQTTPVINGNIYNITVGQSGDVGNNGQNSSIGTLLMCAGGGHGSMGGGQTNWHASDGGSGGGGTKSADSSYLPGGFGILGQGFGGGNASNSFYTGAGGGGSNTVGGSVSSPSGGNGGNGSFINITGVSVCYAGGGGGCTFNANNFGTGTCGGGNGGLFSDVDGHMIQAPTSGTDTLGGGGGGGATSGAGGTTGVSGGNGTIIIRYNINPIPTPNGIITQTKGFPLAFLVAFMLVGILFGWLVFREKR